MKRRTIIHVINSLGVGGAELLLLHISRMLDEYNQVIIVVDRIMEDLNFPSSVRIEELSCEGWLKLPVAITKVKKLISQVQPDIIHSHLYYSSVIAKLATPQSIPLVISLHNEMSRDLYFNKWYSFYNLLIDKITNKKHHVILGVSKVVIDDYIRYVSSSTLNFVLYNFVDDVFLGNIKTGYKKDNSLRLVSVGNLRDQKNHKFLLETLQQYKGLQVEIDIYGNGLLFNQLQNYIEKYHLPVYLKGHIINVHEVLPHYDAFILASKYEGFCIAAVEAMAVGLPLILPDLPIFREVTEDNAFFFTVNDKKSLCESIKEFHRSKPDQIKLMTQKNLELIKRKYTAKAFKKGIQEIYNSILIK